MSSLGAPIVGIPGVRAQKFAIARNLWSGQPLPQYKPQGVLINGSLSRDPLNTGNLTNLRAGLLMGKITATGLWAPSIIGVTTNAEAVGATAIEAAAAVVTELVRRIGSSGTFNLVGPPSANGIVQVETVTYSAASGTGITATAITNAFIAGSLIVPTDGSQNPLSFIDIAYGVPVADLDGTVQSQVQWPAVPVSGGVDESGLINWPSDLSIRAWLIARLNGIDGGQFIFSNRYI